jgi:predicted nucleic acid-binding protein
VEAGGRLGLGFNTRAEARQVSGPLASGVLVDTSVLLDYLQGDARAKSALAGHSHRSISVVTWLEVMANCPPVLVEETRSFLRTFERLSISEAIADEALRLMQRREGLPQSRALTWATAIINQLVLLTADPTHVGRADPRVQLPYTRRPQS